MEMGDQIDQQPVEDKSPEQTKKSETKGSKSFWTTLPGILTAVAGVIGAITALIVALANTGLMPTKAIETSVPILTDAPTQTSTIIPIQSVTLTSTIKPSNTPISSETPTLLPTSTNTTIPPPTVTPRPGEEAEMCVSEIVVVRKGPDTSYDIMGRLNVDKCPKFDLRLMDDSWVQIAQDQRDEELQSLIGGWVKSEYLLEYETVVPILYFYSPDGAEQGFYCIDNGAGMHVRACADTSCLEIYTLQYQECLNFDGRLQDSSWLRIARDQNYDEYADLAHGWVSTVMQSLIFSEFQSFHEKPNMESYLDLLPIVTPPPNPGG
jgi:hypothetical protein